MAFSALEALQAFGAGRQLAQQDRQIRTRQTASQQAASGDFTSAATTAIGGGDFQLAGQIRQLNEQQRNQGLQEAQIIGSEAARIRALPVEQRASAFAAVRPQLQQLGFFSPQELDAVTDFSDAALDGYVSMGQRAMRILQPRGQQQGTTFERDFNYIRNNFGDPAARAYVMRHIEPSPMTTPGPQPGQTLVTPRVSEAQITLPPRDGQPAQSLPPGPEELTDEQIAAIEAEQPVDTRDPNDPAPAFNPAPGSIPSGNPLDPNMGGGGGGGGQSYQDGDTRSINGRSYVRQGGRWRAQGGAQPQAAPQQPQSYVIGQPDPTRLAAEQRAQDAAMRAANADQRAAAAAERAAANVPAGYRQTAAGALEAIPGGPADPARTANRIRPLSDNASGRLADGVTTVSSLERAVNGFQDNYAGNLLGGLENLTQRTVGGGTPGQNQWWADVYATDNVARNALFGASLTAGEQSAWERTTVTPGMSAQEVRTNLTRRLEIAREALQRQARSYRANGYNPEAIEEILGDYRGLVRDTPNTAAAAVEGVRAGGIGAGADPAPPEEDFGRQINQYPEGSAERLQMLERLHNARGQGARLSIQLGGEGQPFLDQYGLTDEQAQQLEAEYQASIPVIEARRNREQWAQENPFLAGVDTTVRAGANALTLGFADRIAGTASGTGADVEHAITNSDWQNRPGAALGGTLAGGLVLPVGSTLPRQIGLGGLYGGTYNFNAADGDVSERLDDALTGATVGSALSGLIGAGMRMTGRGGGPGPANPDLFPAAQRQGVDLMAADVGGPMTRRLTGGTGQTVFGSGQVIRGGQRTENQVGGRLAEIANAEGAPMRREVLGDRVRETFENFNASSGNYGRNLYNNARDLSEGVQMQGTRANEVLTRNLAELQPTANTDAPLISGLQRLQADIAPNGTPANLNVDNMRRLRTSVRSEAQTDALRSTDYQRRANEVLDALSEDLAAQLPPAAAREFREADQLWAQRLDFIDDVENNILGPKNDRSAEAVATRLINMSRGDSARFRRVLDTAPAEESGIIRGSVIQELGRGANGSPNAGAFSLDTFLTNFEALPDRTRDLLFRGQSRADVEDLISIARARREAAGYINRSGTGGSVNTGQLVQNSNQAVQGGSLLAAVGSVGTTAILENLTGRMLASPRLVRILARPPRDPGRFARALRRVAVAEPSLSSNIDTLIQAVQSTGQNLESALPRAAADEGQDRR